MKKYKLIKEYPGSRKIGFIIKPHLTLDPSPGDYYDQGSWFDPSQFPEFWEEVVQKDYEILSFKEIQSGEIYTDCYGVYESHLNSYLEYVKNGVDIIHSVKRLSDGEVFTIGDNCKLTGKIQSFKIDSKSNLCIVEFSSGEDILCFLEKVKTPLFKTEDGVDIYENDNWFIVYIPGYKGTRPLWTLYHSSDGALAIWLDDLSIKRFSTKEKAEEYILMNKPCLSLKEVLELPNYVSHRGCGFAEALQKLVKTKL